MYVCMCVYMYMEDAYTECLLKLSRVRWKRSSIYNNNGNWNDYVYNSFFYGLFQNFSFLEFTF